MHTFPPGFRQRIVRIFPLALMLCCGHPCSRTAVIAEELDGDRLLDPNRMIEIKIEVAPDDWEQLRRQAHDPATAFSGLPGERPYTYFRADLWIDGEKLESVGIRKKGFFGSADIQRPSLKVKFDAYKDQDPIKGLSRLTLNNNKQDRSQASQFLTYRLFRRAGNPAPRSNWAHVVVNGENLGIYSHVESIKKPFLKRAFADKSGNLYEGSLTDFRPKSLDNVEAKTNEGVDDRSDVERLAAVLAKEGELDLNELSQIINIDAFFRHWALEGLTGFWDGYSSNQNNFYLYFNPQDNGRGHFIPWGADWVFTDGGPFGRGRGGGSRPSTVIYAHSILANRLYHSQDGAKRYQATLRRLLDEVWDEDAMLAEVDRIEALVSPHLHPSQAGTPSAMNELRAFVRGRREVVERALDNWRPNVPSEPRTPSYVVDVGTAKGSFFTTFRRDGGEPTAESRTKIVIQLGEELVNADHVVARTQPLPFGGFGGFRGPPGGGLGGSRGPRVSRPGATSASPVNLVFTADRADGAPIAVSLTIDRARFHPTGEGAIRISGSLREGQRNRVGLGGRPGRSVIGNLQLSQAGTEPGDPVAGQIELRIVETHGGFWQQRQGGGGRFASPPGGRDIQRPGSGSLPAGFGRPPSISLQRALDTDRDGTISADEIGQATAALKRLDRNRDGKLTADELRSPPRGAGAGNRPRD